MPQVSSYLLQNNTTVTLSHRLFLCLFPGWIQAIIACCMKWLQGSFTNKLLFVVVVNEAVSSLHLKETNLQWQQHIFNAVLQFCASFISFFLLRKSCLGYVSFPDLSRNIIQSNEFPSLSSVGLIKCSFQHFYIFYFLSEFAELLSLNCTFQALLPLQCVPRRQTQLLIA